MKKFSDLKPNQVIYLNNMAGTYKGIVVEKNSEFVLIKWDDNTTDEVSLNKEVILEDSFSQFTCGFQAIKLKPNKTLLKLKKAILSVTLESYDEFIRLSHIYTLITKKIEQYENI